MNQIVLLPSYAQAQEHRKALADVGSPTALGVQVTTQDAWLDELWSLFGDGRAIVDSMTRDMLLAYAMRSTGDFPVTPGTLMLISRMVKEGMGLPAFMNAMKGSVPVTITRTERALLGCASEYHVVLSRAGLVEPGEVMAALPGCVPNRYDLTVKGFGLLHPGQRAFFEAMGGGSFAEEPASDRVHALDQSIEASFLFPGGAYARPSLVADQIAASCAEGATAFVACKKPLDVYEACAPLLAAQGITCGVRARKRFFDTAFGRAIVSLYEFKSADECRPALLTDFLTSPFSGVGRRTAFDLDARMRGNRLITKEECLARVLGESEQARYCDEIVSDLDASILIGSLIGSMQGRSDWSDACRVEQIAAAFALRRVMETARACGLDLPCAMMFLEFMYVNVSQATAEPPQVLFATQQEASNYRPGSFDVVVATELDSVSYAVKNRTDSVTTLFEKLGIDSKDDALARVRRNFVATENLARVQFVCERAMNDEDANPTYPCIPLQEFIDCYRENPSATDDVDETYGLPQELLATVRSKGEEALYENAAHDLQPQQPQVVVDRPVAGQVSDGSRHLVVLPRIDRTCVVETPCLSPSQIESYLECPHKWFAHRRLRLEGIDEGFGAVEMGDFAHAVLNDFYTVFMEEGHARVTADNRDRAVEVLAACFDGRRAIQAEPAHGRQRRNRLVATTSVEELQIDALKDKLVRFVLREANMLPDFHPHLLEYEIPIAQAVDYAGVKVFGRVDRVDIDEAGRAVVIDYKGSVSERYAAFGEGGVLANGKVQALIYAQLLRRHLGLDVRGALYISYGKTPVIRGAYDGSLMGKLDLPGCKVATCEFHPVDGRDFGSVLDETEERVAEHIKHLLEGIIEPAPAYATVCDWCPVKSCPKRGADE
ncbi:Inactivated superfamily I helicase [Slackia heliotrinireducens]|uniref:RecB family exonuclease n=1 Tax=Slackia heliotrinireducens (strain ATCC 29202 / DSM 20476 / NCTC 11029 / RHS 1) TaxID=471855 RepID=C7N4R4_SLAHD|nr:PD-(D/E)XK nuclease family protein [Slackia heliotrinireducens]ACV21899.1 RecB family exonuclease [Slackia heliotrinireducens DSM 20476]VEG99696.1 Inactivated superfamily I helicase [Slackia heliotrinireducens]